MKRISIALVLLAANGATAQELTLGADDKTVTQRAALAGSTSSSTDVSLASRIETLELQLAAMQSRLDNLQSTDSQPPTITINAPTYASQSPEIVSASFTDDQGLFEIKVGALEPYDPEDLTWGEARTLLAGEKSTTLEINQWMEFGFDTVVQAYAIDLAGNAATAFVTIASQTAIKSGAYTLDVPLNEEISGEGCYLELWGPVSISASRLHLGGYYKRTGDVCDGSDPNEAPDAVACIYTGLEWSDGSFGLGGQTVSGISSLSDTYYSKDELTYPETGSTGEDQFFTYMDVQYFDTNPPSVRVDMTLRCESPVHGTTEFGPYQLEGTLEQ
jgi:hypothetical protein